MDDHGTRVMSTKTAEMAEPTREAAPMEMGFPIVGIGASAGGLAAFEAFFSGMPSDTDPGMAFVLVQHLAPDHKSILTDLIRRYTRMQVFEVVDGMKVQVNCAYIIPPGYDMAFLSGCLQLMEPSSPRGQRLPIDFFFRSLAQDQRERSIAIVLSGTGSDGSLGVRAIKGEAGMVMAQSPESSEYDGMPRSAIATGMVDFELPPAEMAAALISYTAHAFGKAPLESNLSTEKANSLKKIFILLRNQTGHDFSQYKPNTIMRRIERRMTVHRIDRIDAYVKYLQSTTTEVQALFRDMLIGVTSFFRDPEAFAALEHEVIPRLFTDKNPGSSIRVWTPGCSTGEEAYSIAILLVEYMEKVKKNVTLQVFATDIDPQAIATARSGIYPASIAADLTAERLVRFFTAEPARKDGIPLSYRINKSIRDVLVFSEQSVIKDPPFSRLDLISCRNLMIYLSGDLQKKLIPLFHYALNPLGLLFLGTSETVGEFTDLFSVLDRKAKLYACKREGLGPGHKALGSFLPPMTTPDRPHPLNTVTEGRAAKVPLRALAEQAILKKLAPSSALVNSRGDIFYLHGRTGLYLEPDMGEVGVYNILKMAREGLKRELTTALYKAIHTQETIVCRGLRVKTNSHYTPVDLSVCPVEPDPGEASSPPLYLVVLQEGHAFETYQRQESTTQADNPEGGVVASLQRELKAKEEYLQSANEELETSNDELKSSNEEMQSVNEELQSTNEELVTSKEELQSVNEELATVNAELQTKVADLSTINNDMNNLLAGTGIATVFVDHQMRILRFTPAANELINLVKDDVGRPLFHFVNNLVGYQTMKADIQTVLDTLVPREVEVESANGRLFTMRILPYRTMDNVIEGAVITFVDVTKMKQMMESLLEAKSLNRLAVIVQDSNDAITVQDLEGRTLAWNQSASRIYGWSEAEALAMNVRDRIPDDQRPQALAKLLMLSQSEALPSYATRRITKDGHVVEVTIIATALVDAEGKMYAVATTERLLQPAEGRANGR
jgi:two-component system CheB/CheR fusion protein